MKKTILFAIECIAIMAVSCNKGEVYTSQKDDVNTDLSEGIPVTITASVESETKTTYSNGTNFSWTAGDKISVLCYSSAKSDYQFVEFVAESSENPTTFKGYMPSGYRLNDYALYPASDNHDYSGSTLLFNIPKYKDLTSEFSADLPLVGKKGTGNDYTFTHCSGATKITVDNIPEKYKSITVSFTSRTSGNGVKISGSFGTFSDNGYYKWNSVYADNDNDKNYTRKVSVNNHKAIVYIPFATGGNIYGSNTVTITGHDAKGVETSLYSNTSVNGIGPFVRAEVIPLKPLIICRLEDIDWTNNKVVTNALDSWAASEKVGLSEMKLFADDYYLYARVKGATSSLSSDNYLDIYLTDGTDEDGSTNPRDTYWLTNGKTWYNKEHKGVITTSPIGYSMKFNVPDSEVIDLNTTVETANSGADIIWQMAFPRSCHSLLSSSGKVYVGFLLWEGWGIVGCLPTQRTWDHESYMQEFTLP